MIVEDSTCTESGSVTKICSVCSYVDIFEEVEPNGHTFTSVVTPPTCVDDGYTTKTCSVCGESEIFDTVPAVGHTNTVVVTPATCTTDGYLGDKICVACNYLVEAGNIVEKYHLWDGEKCTVCGITELP